MGVALAGRAERNLQLFIFRTHAALSDLLVAQLSSPPPPVGLKLKPRFQGTQPTGSTLLLRNIGPG